MQSHKQELRCNIPTWRAFVNITPLLEECVWKLNQRSFLLCSAMHITASVFVNDGEEGLYRDFERWLEKLAPEKPYGQYRRNVGEDSADTHLKRSVTGREVIVAITDGELDLGP